MQSIKEHNLKANHNECVVHILFLISVCNLSKNTIWKQITTYRWHWHWRKALYAIYQRTQFESKSQRLAEASCTIQLCMQSIKEHNLKANHNPNGVAFIQVSSVCNLSKNTIWKQITTWRPSSVAVSFLYAIYQRTQFESKSQRIQGNKTLYSICMQSIKEHNLKANHN